MKLSTKLTLLVLVAVLLPLLGLGSVVYVMQKQVTAERLQQQLQQQGTSAIHHIRDHLLENYRDLGLVTGSSTLRPHVWTPEYGLNRYLASFPMYDALVYTDRNGKLIAHAGSPLLTEGDASLEHAAADWHKAAQAGAKIIDRATPKQGAMPRYLIFARQVSDPGVVHGWVFAQINSEKFVDLIQETKIGKTGHITLFNRNGILIGHPNKSRYGFDMSHYPIMRKPVLEGVGDPGNFFVSGDGREKWGLTIMLPDHPDLADLGWGVIADQTRKELYEPALDLLKTILLGATIFGIVFVLCGIVFARRLIRPVFEINRSLNSFFAYLSGKAEAPAHLKIAGNDEFAQIAKAIDQSTQAAEASIRRAREVEALRDETLNRLNAVLQTALDGYWLVDHEGRLLDVNESAAAMLGYAREAMIGLSVKDIDTIDTPDEIRARTERMLKSGGERFESKHRKQSGEIIDIEASISLLPDGSAFVVFVHDITQSKRANLALQESETTFRTLFEGSSDAILLIDSTGVFVECNQAALELLKMTREQFLLSPLARISPKFQPDGRRSAASAPEMIALAYSKGLHRFDWTCINAEGEEFIVEVSLMPIAIKGQTLLHVSWRDMTKRKQMEEQIRQLAFYDTLTGLPNRRLLQDRLSLALATSKRNDVYGALLFLDLDNFKPLNDAYGHDVGDLLLIEAARRLKNCVRAIDTVARFGGDEFVVVISALEPTLDKSVEQARKVAEKVRDALSETYVLARAGQDPSAPPIEHHCTVSIGVEMFFNHTESCEKLMKRADAAMYRAKEGGRNRIQFNDLIDQANGIVQQYANLDSHSRRLLKSDTCH